MRVRRTDVPRTLIFVSFLLRAYVPIASLEHLGYHTDSSGILKEGEN